MGDNIKGWTETTVGDFTPFLYGKGLSERQRNQAGTVPVFGSNGIVGTHNEALVNNAGVIIGRKGTVGIVHFCKGPFWPIDTAFYVESKPDREIRYIYYLLRTLGLEHMNADSAVPGLNRNAAHARKILVPPLPEQKAIASILGVLDDKIELNRKMNQTLEAMARAIFKSWFVDFDPIPGFAPHKEWQDSPLGKIPKGWRMGTIEDLGHVICGKTPPTADSENYGTEMPFITIPDMHGQIFIIDTEKKLSPRGVSTQPSKTLPALSVCVSCIATPGLVVLTTKPSQTNQQINSVIPKKEMSPFYCYMALNELAHEIKARGSGGSVTLNLNKTQFAAEAVIGGNKGKGCGEVCGGCCMISKGNSDVREFSKLISSWKEVYKWKMTSFVAINTLEGPRLLIGRIIFDSVKPLDSLHFNFESSHIIAGREISETTIEDIDLCIKNATEGKLVSSKQTFSLYLKNSDTLGTTFFPVYHPTITFGPRLSGLIIRGSRRYELLSPPNFRPMELPDWDLKAADQPFDSLDELFTHLGFPTSQQAGDSAALEIIGTSPALIADDSKITAGSAQVKCRLAETADIKKVKFGYKIFHANSVERASITGDAFEWVMDGSLKIGSADIPTKDAPVLQGFLSYDGISLHQWWIDDPEKRLNQRHAMHEIFDKELGFVRKFLLTPEGKQNRSFEHGVALLLNILGFSVSHYGKLSNMEDGPDIIAITTSGNVGVIECTTGLLNAKDKLVKLAQRTSLIKENLKKTGHGHLPVQPVIVTALPKNEVEAGLEQAGENGVAVVCKENIEELLRRVTLPPNLDALFREAQQLIPRAKQQSSFQS